MILRLNSRYSLNIEQVYASTANHTAEEVDLFYDEATKPLNQDSTHFTIIYGDLNSKIGIRFDPSGQPR